MEPGAQVQATSTSGSPGSTHTFPSRRSLPLLAAVCKGPGPPQTPSHYPGSQHPPFLPENTGQSSFRRKPTLSQASEPQDVRSLHGWIFQRVSFQSRPTQLPWEVVQAQSPFSWVTSSSTFAVTPEVARWPLFHTTCLRSLRWHPSPSSTLQVLGMDMYTLLYFKWITNKDLLYSTGNSAQCYIAAQMGGVGGRVDTCICMYGWIPLPFTWDYHNIVNQLYSNTKLKVQ